MCFRKWLFFGMFLVFCVEKTLFCWIQYLLHPWTKMFSDMGLGAVICLSIQPWKQKWNMGRAFWIWFNLLKITESTMRYQWWSRESRALEYHNFNSIMVIFDELSIFLWKYALLTNFRSSGFLTHCQFLCLIF